MPNTNQCINCSVTTYTLVFLTIMPRYKIDAVEVESLSPDKILDYNQEFNYTGLLYNVV